MFFDICGIQLKQQNFLVFHSKSGRGGDFSDSTCWLSWKSHCVMGIFPIVSQMWWILGNLIDCTKWLYFHKCEDNLY
jgi:hypothetical protein